MASVLNRINWIRVMTGLPNRSRFSNRKGFMGIWNPSVQKLWEVFGNPFITLHPWCQEYVQPLCRQSSADYGEALFNSVVICILKCYILKRDLNKVLKMFVFQLFCPTPVYSEVFTLQVILSLHRLTWSLFLRIIIQKRVNWIGLQLIVSYNIFG